MVHQPQSLLKPMAKCWVSKDPMRKILVVDDDPDLLDLLNVGLTEAGYSVITAANGRDALEQARSLPDLIVLDLVLPEMDGFTVCQALKRDRRRPPSRCCC